MMNFFITKYFLSLIIFDIMTNIYDVMKSVLTLQLFLNSATEHHILDWWHNILYQKANNINFETT